MKIEKVPLERQLSETLDDIRPDHLERYKFARSWLVKNRLTKKVLDVGAGIGYGSHLLSEEIDKVVSIEISPEAQAIFEKSYKKSNINYINKSLFDVKFWFDRRFDAIVCFEFIEHVPEEMAVRALKRFGKLSSTLIFSTPNEKKRPHSRPPVNPFHFRHYKPGDMKGLLKQAGFRRIEWWCQTSGSKPKIRPGTDGKFIIGVATRY